MTMDFSPAVERLREEMGLDPASIGEHAVIQALHRRMIATGCRDEVVYIEHLSDSPEEVQALIEEVAIPETWFFREESAFACLRRHVRQNFPSVGKRQSFRVACIPCATGEEAYSIVMAILETGLYSDRFQVDALDISQRALMCARQAVYGEYSFRAADKTFREHYFHIIKEGYRLDPAVRDPVRFYHGSVLALPPPFVSTTYDVVFCRNLLIYLNGEARTHVMMRLRKILAPDGILLVGHSEVSIALHEGFERSADGALRISRKNILPAPQSLKRIKVKPPVRHDENREPVPQRLHSMEIAATVAPKRAVVVASADIAEIRSMADAGRLDEARLRCDARLREGEHSAALYCLLGLIQNAQGDPRAARESYRKAIYLDPSHTEARQHLSMLEKWNRAG